MPKIASRASAEATSAPVYTISDEVMGEISSDETRDITYNYSGSATSNAIEDNEFEIDVTETADMAAWLSAVNQNYYSDVDFEHHASKTVPVSGYTYDSTADTHTAMNYTAAGYGGNGADNMFCEYTYYIASNQAARSSIERYIGIDDSNNAVLTETKTYPWKIINYNKADGSTAYIFISASENNMALTVNETNQVVLQELAVNSDGTYAPSEGQLFAFSEDKSTSKNYNIVEIRGAAFETDETAARYNLRVSKNYNVGDAVQYNVAHTGGHQDTWFFEYAEPYYDVTSLTFPDGFVSYTWSTSDSSIAEISDTGRVRIYSDGEVTFTCTVTAGGPLTARSDLDNVREIDVTYNFTKHQLNNGNPLTDTTDTTQFPAAGDPGSVIIDKSADDTLGYDKNGVAKVQLDVTSITGDEPIDVVLVIDVSRSMIDFYSHDVIFCEGTRSGNDDDGYTYTGSRDVTYYIEKGYIDQTTENKTPYSEDSVAVKDMNGNTVYYCKYTKPESDTQSGTYTLYTVAEDGTETVIKTGASLEEIAPDGCYRAPDTAGDEYTVNYDKIKAARESASTFVETLLDASPDSRIALVQFAEDKPKADGSYFKVNSRVITGFTNDKNRLLTLIENKATDSENRYAIAGMGSGYLHYSPTNAEHEAIEPTAATSGLTISTVGGTNYGLAFERAEEAINADTGTPNARRIVVFMTDGEPNTINLANASNDSVFGTVNENNNSSQMKIGGKVKDASSWSYFALRRQFEARNRIEEKGFEIISIGFDLDSDGTGYLGVYNTGDKYILDGSTITTSLAKEFNSTGDDYYLLCDVRKKVVENLATFDSEYKAVEKGADGSADYSSLNTTYEKIAQSIMYTTKNAVVTDVIGDDFELRILPYNNKSTEITPQISVSSCNVSVSTDENSKKVITDIASTANTIETVTFVGSSLAEGIDVMLSSGSESPEKILTITADNYNSYVITGNTFTYDNSTKTFTWTVGDVISEHFTISYDAYLTGSDPAYEQAMGRADESWQKNGSNVDFAEAKENINTNESATVAYTNYLGNDCLLTYEKPELDWDTTSVSVTKVWEDDNDSRELRPYEITVQLKATVNGTTTNVYEAATLNSDNSWSKTWSNLPLYSDGNAITYSISETTVDNYTTSYEQEENNFTITNTLRKYSLTVKYEELNKDGVNLIDPAYPLGEGTVIAEGTQYDVVKGGYKHNTITVTDPVSGETKTYIYYDIKDGSGAEASDENGIQGNVEITYLYVEYEKPAIEKFNGTGTNKTTNDTVVNITDLSEIYYIEYTVSVANPNPYAMTDILCSDVLPAGLEYVSCTPDNVNMSVGTDKRTLSWTFDEIARNGTADIVIKAKILDNTASITYTNFAQIDSAKLVPEDGSSIDMPDSPIESNDVNTTVERYYDVTVNYKTVDGVPIGEETIKPYSSLLEGSAYDVTDKRLDEITDNGVVYTFCRIDESSDAEAVTAENGGIRDNVVVTYLYYECKAPEITKAVDKELVKITTPVDSTDYIIEYTITVANPNPYEITNVNCSDVLPDGIEFYANGSDSRIETDDNKNLQWVIQSIPKNDDVEVVFYAKITDTVKAPYTNYAVVDSASFDPDKNGVVTTVEYVDDPDTPEDESVKSDPVKTDVYMTPEITKEVDKDLAAVDQYVEYKIHIRNTSSVTLYDIKVTDTIPEGMEFSAGSDTAAAEMIIYSTDSTLADLIAEKSVTVSGRDVTAHIPALGRYDTATIILNVKITDGSKLIYKNTAYIAEGYLEPVPEGTTPDSNIDRTPSNEVETKIDADPYITKNVDKSAAYYGDELVYTLIVTNNTADPLYNVKVTDVVPDALLFLSADNNGTYDAETKTVTWIIDTVAPGDYTLTFNAEIISPSAEKITNTGVLVEGYTDTDGDGTKEPHSYNKNDTADTQIIKDPQIHKSVDKPLTFMGDNIVYSFNVVNTDKVFDLYNVVVTDTLPEGLEIVSVSEGVTYEGREVSYTAEKLAANAHTSFTVTAKLTGGTNLPYENTAYITDATVDTDKDGDVDTNDRVLTYPDGTNHSETVITDVHYDLVIEYRAESKDGEEIELPYNSNDNKRGTNYDVTDLIYDTIVDEENGIVWVKKEVTADSAAPEGTFDSDKKIVVIYERFDSLYSIKKYVSTDGTTWVDDKVTVAPGTTVYFKVKVENLCGHTVENISLGDVLKKNGIEIGKPDAWTNVIAAFETENGTTLPVSGWESAPMAYPVPDTAVGTDRFVNTATVYNSDDSIPSISDDATVEVYRVDALEITKTAQLKEDENGVKKAAQGQNVPFIITVTNKGNTLLKNVEIIDNTYDVTYQGIAVTKGTVITTIPSLAPDASESITVYFPVPESAETGAVYDNYATAKSVDGNGDELIEMDNDAITVERVEPKLSVIKTVNGEDKYIAEPGEKVTFSITVENTGNADAENVYISDHMLVNGEKSQKEWALTGNWTVSVSAGDAVVVADAIEWTVPAGTPSDTDFVNVALLYNSEKDFTDGKAPIDEDTAEVLTEGVYAIDVQKTANVATAKPGENITYAIAVTNKSNAPLTDISVADLLPGTWGELPTETEQGNAVSIISDSDNVLHIDTLAQSDVVWLSFVYTVPEDYTENTVINTVNAESDTPDGMIDDEASAPTAIHINSLNVTKEAHCEEAYAGDKVYYYITVKNTGKNTLENVVITEKLDVTVLNEYVQTEGSEISQTDLTAEDISGTDISTTDLVIGYVESLASGESRVLYVEYIIPEDAEVGDEIWNTVTAKADGGHEDSASDDVTVIEYVERDYKLSITKTTAATLVNEGDTVSYLITVTNTGKDDLTNVVVTDSLDVVYGGKEYKAGTVLETIELLKSGESKILNVSYTVPTGFSGKDIVNTATADSTETEKVEASAKVTLRAPDVKLTKTVNSQSAVAGEKVYYKLVVTNTGNCTLTDVLVQDTSVGYSFTIARIEPGEVWESADGALSYTFANSASAGTSFQNNASVINAEVKGSANTVTTVYNSDPGYTAPDTGDDSEKTDNAFAAVMIVSFAVMLALGAIMLIKRRNSKSN